MAKNKREGDIGARQNTEQFVTILTDASHQNVF